MARVPCPRCGYQNREGAPFCELCQVSFASPSRQSDRSRAAGSVSGPPALSSPQSPAPVLAPAGRTDFYLEQARNTRKSWALAGIVGLILILICGCFGGVYQTAPLGIAAGVILALGSGLFAYFAGDRAVLAVSGARNATREEFPVLANVVEEMCLASGLPRPSLFVIEDSAPNAFATGRDPEHASIAVTRGLLDKMSRDELQGVIAHEMGHIRNFDVRFSMMVGILVGTIALLCDFFWRSMRYGGLGSTRTRRTGRGAGGVALFALLALVLSLLAPVVSWLLQMAVSRKRELLADASSVELTRNPLALASALEKIDRDPEVLEVANRATQHLYIVNPLRRFDLHASALFSTHPPIEARIRLLRAMA